MIRFSRIGPPSIHSHIIHRCKILPIEITCLFIKRIVRSCTRISRPRIKRNQSVHLFQFLILVGPWSETGPNRNHQMSILLVHIIYHFLRAFDARFFCQFFRLFAIRHILHPFFITNLIYIIGIHELHGIPVRVTSPVLPVLHNTVERNFELTIFIENATKFIRTFIALATLPITHCPKRKHGSLSGQIAQRRYHSIHRSVLIKEIIIGNQSYLR